MRRYWGGLLVFLASALPVFADDISIPDLRWAALEEGELGPALYAPAEQANPFELYSDAYWDYELGRVAFRSPTLLGGLAAREGMSCNSCHLSGGTNRHFFVDGVSSSPGTFDPTNSLFSTHTEDGIENAVPIPMLYGVAKTAPYPSDGRFATLDQMVTHVIEDEFDGLKPPEKVKLALLTYVSTLEAPITAEPVALTPHADLGDVARMVDLMARATSQRDGQVFLFVANAARRQLGLIHNRFTNAQPLQQRLLDWSATIKTARDLVALDQFDKAGIELAKIEISIVMFDDVKAAIPGSLYEEETLRTYIEGLNGTQ